MTPTAPWYLQAEKSTGVDGCRQTAEACQLHDTTADAHISHSGAQLEPQAGKGVIGLGDQQLLAK